MDKGKIYEIRFLEKVERFIRGLVENDRAKIAAAIKTLENGDFQSIEVKTLKGRIKELVVKSYRIVFFIDKDHIIYLLDGFIKKTRKTPRNIIENAKKISKIIDK